MRKEQGEWTEANTKRQQVLEADLQSKISLYADKETEYVQKWENLEESKTAFSEERQRETAKLDSIRKEAESEYL